MSDDDIKIHGPLRRNAPLLGGVVFVLIIGPFASQLLTSYRGVVLEHREGQSLIGFEEKPPSWIDGSVGAPGDVIVKERFDWTPHTVPTQAGDHQLQRLHQRYSNTYQGQVVHIEPPRVASGPYVALIEKTDGARINVPIHGAHLSALKVGDRVAKHPASWEPVIVEASAEQEATPAPAPGPAPSPQAPRPDDTEG